MARIPTPITAPGSPTPRRSLSDQILLALVSAAPQLALGIMQQRRLDRETAIREEEAAARARADDLAAKATSSFLSAALDSPGMAGKIAQDMIRQIAGVNPVVEAASGPGGVQAPSVRLSPNAVADSVTEALQNTPGASLLLSPQIRDTLSAAVGIERQQQAMRLAEEQAERQRSLDELTLEAREFENSLQGLRKEMLELQVEGQRLANEGRLADLDLITLQQQEVLANIRRQATQTALSIIGARQEMANRVFASFPTETLDPSQSAKLLNGLYRAFGADIDASALASTITEKWLKGEGVEQEMQILSYNPTYLVGAVAGFPEETVDSVLDAVKAGQDLENLFQEQVKAVRAAVKAKAMTKQEGKERISALHTLFSTAAAWGGRDFDAKIPQDPRWMDRFRAALKEFISGADVEDLFGGAALGPFNPPERPKEETPAPKPKAKPSDLTSLSTTAALSKVVRNRQRIQAMQDSAAATPQGRTARALIIRSLLADNPNPSPEDIQFAIRYADAIMTGDLSKIR